jgi:hypothetical protein
VKRLYELINPSDAICFETNDEEALNAGVLLLGGGWYGLIREDGVKTLPITPFGDEAEAAAKRVSGFLDQPDGPRRVAAALRTVLYCKMRDRLALDAALAGVPDEHRQAAIAKFNDTKRTSLNDIGARALSLAEHFEKGPTP